MATEKLRYYIEAVWKGGRATAKASADIESVGDAAEKSGRRTVPSLHGIAAGLTTVGVAAGGMYLAAREAWQILGEGADLATAEYQFERLAESIDSTADVMLGKLREATGGMVTDAGLVQSASDIMSLGLQDTEDGVVRLATVVGKLGLDMNQVILTMANNSRARLDALGISIESVESKMASLEAQGFNADEAFDLAVIEALEEKILLVGDAADTDAAKMALLETAVANAWEQFQVDFATSTLSQFSDVEAGAASLEGTLDSLGAHAISAWERVMNAVSFFSYSSQIAAGTGTGTPYTTEQGYNIWSVATRDRDLDALERIRASRIQTQSRGIGEAPPAAVIRQSTAAVIENKEAWEIHNESQRKVIAYQRELEGELADNTAGLGGYSSAVASASEEMRALASASGDFFSQARGMKEFNLAEEFFKMADAAGASAAELADLGVASGVIDPGDVGKLLNEAYLLQAGQHIAAAIGEGMKPDEAWAELMGLQAGLDESGEIAREFFAGLDAETAEPTMSLITDPALEQYYMLKSAIENDPPRVTAIVDFPGVQSSQSELLGQQGDKLEDAYVRAGL